MQYTEEEMNKSHRAYLINMIGFGLWLLLAAGLTVYFLIARNRTGAVLSFVIGGVAAIFYWGVLGGDVARYERFLRGIRTGLHSSFTGTVLSVGEVAVHDDLPMQQIRIQDEEEDVERLCYRDVFKTDPVLTELKAGDRYRFTTHAQAIIAMEAADSAETTQE